MFSFPNKFNSVQAFKAIYLSNNWAFIFFCGTLFGLTILRFCHQLIFIIGYTHSQPQPQPHTPYTIHNHSHILNQKCLPVELIFYSYFIIYYCYYITHTYTTHTHKHSCTSHSHGIDSKHHLSNIISKCVYSWEKIKTIVYINS